MACAALALMVVAVVADAVAPSGTSFPAAVDTTLVEVYSRDPNTLVCSGPGGTGCTVLASSFNTVQSGLLNLETALGADATWASSSVLTRLAAKVGAVDNTAFTGKPTFKQIDNTLVASAYSGDVGQQVNAAIADCTTRFGSDWCRVVLRPNSGTTFGNGFGFTSANVGIAISRSKTMLDCQGARLVADSSFTDSMVKINVYNLGSYNESAISDVVVQNCDFEDHSQTSRASISTDTRSAVVTAYNVDNLRLNNVVVRDALGKGIFLRKIRGGMVQDLAVFGTRTSGSPDPTGITLWGDGYGVGSSGEPISAGNLKVAPSGINGVAGRGVQLVVGVQAERVAVSTAQGACVSLGGDSTQGWITLDNIDLSDCQLSAVALAGAIDDTPAASNALTDVHISNGRIRRMNSDGIRLVNAASYTSVSIDNVSIECPATAVNNSNGLRFAGIGDMLGVTNNAVLYSSSCAGPASNAGGLTFTATDSSNITIVGNRLRGANSATKSGRGITITTSEGAGAIVRAQIVGNNIRQFGNYGILFDAADGGTLLADVVGNTFSTNCKTGDSDCAAVTGTASTSDAVLGALRFFSNSSDGHPYSLSVDTSSGIVGPFVIDGNDFRDTADYLWTTDPATSGGLFEGFVASRLATSNIFTNRAPSSIKLTNGNPGTITKLTAVCIDNSGPKQFTGCAAIVKKTVVGVLTEDTATGALGTIVTRGIVKNVACSGTVVPGDMLETNDSSVAITASSPVVGGVLGKALTACTSSKLTALITVD